MGADDTSDTASVRRRGADADAGPVAKRPKLGRIRLDDRIAEAKARESAAKIAVKAARTAMRNEKRRRARLVKKAAALSIEELEEIAKLKKAGLWNPGLGASSDAPVDRRDVSAAVAAAVEEVAQCAVSKATPNASDGDALVAAAAVADSPDAEDAEEEGDEVSRHDDAEGD